MPAKLDGTNGLLQQYDYQTPTTGFSYTFAAGVNVLVMQPAGTLATGTITMPAAPADGMTITFSSSQQITALTVQGNTGQSMSNAVTFLPGKTAASYVYRLSNTTWYPMQTVPGTGSQLVSGTVQNSTSGTSIDFTNIPSWVKRITVMFNGVSTSGNSAKIIQLGDSGGVETSGYIGTGTVLGNGSGTSTAMSSGFFASQASAATDVLSGQATISLLDSATNTWAYSGVFGQSTATAIIYWSGGAKPLSATLDRVRITTVGSPATDTFDAGSINILYE
jgi:hypothetical protein